MGDHTVLRIKCWDALVRRRHLTGEEYTTAVMHSGEDPYDLVSLVEEVSETTKELWVMAHNVGFDISVTSLPYTLFARGWDLGAFHIGDESSYWILKKKTHRIVITDSWSWLRAPLSDVAKDIGRRKARLPNDGDHLKDWHKRSRIDVEILDEAMMIIMDWWDEQDIGKFGITGASCGWRAMRTMITPQAMLVGPDEGRTEFERQAVFGGRREVYVIGRVHDTWCSDNDFVSAYPTVCAAFKLPTRPVGKWCDDSELLSSGVHEGRDYIAEVEITTKIPCAPCRVNGEVWWPVGTFKTTLSGPEVRYAMEVAESVRVIDWQGYALGFVIADWAGWCLGLQSAPHTEVPPVVRRVVKTWGRSVTGKFAGRTSRVISVKPSMHFGWHLETGHDLDSGRPIEIMSMNGVEKTSIKDLDAADCFPAVLAFIEGHTRVALGKMMQSRVSGHLIQCNTDGWWESKAVRANSHEFDNVPYPFRVVRKALERSITVLGPNHIMTPHEERLSGIAATAEVELDGTRHWHEWPGVKWQLENGKLGEYHRPERFATLAPHYAHRWVMMNGETLPVTCKVSDVGENEIEPWHHSWGRLGTDVLAEYQMPTLMDILAYSPEALIRRSVPLPAQPGRNFPSRPQRINPRTSIEMLKELKMYDEDLCPGAVSGDF